MKTKTTYYFSDVEKLKEEKALAEAKLEKITSIWEKAFAEFQRIKDALKEEIEEHEQTKQRLTHSQQLLETITQVASVGLLEYNQLKISYAEECTLRKEYEEKLRASGNLIEKHNDNSKQEAEAKIMSQNISNVYLLPTLTDLGARLEECEQELQLANQEKKKAEENLHKIQNATIAALEEFNDLKQKYVEECMRRQEAEKLAADYKITSESSNVSTSYPYESIQSLTAQLEKEKQYRKLAEQEVDSLTRQLNQKQGKQFDLMTLTELECKLEDANRSLEAMTIRAQKAEEERITLIQENEDLKNRAGMSGFVPPPPPPPPVFVAIQTQENLKKKIGDLKTKLQGNPQDEKLGDLRSQAMLELQAKLQKRKQTTNESEPPKKVEPKGNGQLENLATILTQTKTPPNKPPKNETKSQTKSQTLNLDDAFLDLEKEFNSFQF